MAKAKGSLELMFVALRSGFEDFWLSGRGMFGSSRPSFLLPLRQTCRIILLTDSASKIIPPLRTRVQG